MYPIIKRLMPDQDLKHELTMLASEYKLDAGVIVSGVGSFKQANIRTSAENGQATYRQWKEHLEIVSITGTISQKGMHVHVSFADIKGHTFGGHLTEGCLVFTVIEVVIMAFEDVVFEREYDELTGFKELIVKSI